MNCLKAAYDLHIHSCLSPCADMDMTPNNIVNMAVLKGLNVISVTDHNSCKNLRAAYKCAQAADLLFVPGIELETAEEIHMLCYFKSVEATEEFYASVEELMPNMKNKVHIFGEQAVMDEDDNIIDYENRMLIMASAIDSDSLFDRVNAYGGIVVPAHIDRDSYSILNTFGMLPDLKTGYVEVSKNCHISEFKKYNNINYNILSSSDAHYLWDISEKQNFIELEVFSADCVVEKLKSIK